MHPHFSCIGSRRKHFQREKKILGLCWQVFSKSCLFLLLSVNSRKVYSASERKMKFTKDMIFFLSLQNVLTENGGNKNS